MKAAIQSVVGGFLLGSLPFWLSKIHWEPPRWLAAVEEVTTFLLLPGLLVALVVARGRYDDINIVVAVIASCFFYSARSTSWLAVASARPLSGKLRGDCGRQ